MSFNPNTGRIELVASAGQTVFTFDFKIFLNTDVQVYLTPSGQIADDTTDVLILTTDYTVAITGDSGGTVTLVSAASIGDSITIVRVLPITRYIEFQNNGDLLASTLNLDQDYQAYLIADKEADNTRFLKIPDSAQGIETTIPPPTPLNFFQWNAAGDAIVNVNTLIADGYVWTAGDTYTKNELVTGSLDTRYYTETEIDAAVAKRRKLYASETVTHNFTTDADYTLTSAQNAYGRIILTDTGVVLTTARNIITDNVQKSFIVQNDTLQDITVKTLAGTGILVLSGESKDLYNDGTNIIEPVTSGILLAEHIVTGAAASSIDFSGLDISVHKSYRIEIELQVNAATDLQLFVNGDTVATNYYSQTFNVDNATFFGGRVNNATIASSPGTRLVCDIRLQLSPNGDFLARNTGSYSGTTAVRVMDYVVTNATVSAISNITQITFAAAVASSIDIGSKIRIYRGDI